MPTALLPILPLRRVVLPGTAHVVRAFDDAARAMVADLDAEGFGAVLARGSVVDGPGVDYHGVGTQMRIVDRIDQPDGRVTLQALGRRRFAVRSRRPGPYPRAVVEYLEDGDSERAAILAGEVGPLLRRYLAAAVESGERGNVLFEVDADPVALSYQVASLMRLSAPERQELLELPAEMRLARERTLLAREIDLLERTMGIERG